MQILKIPWLGHKTENKNIECYSVTVNNDGTRLASGGLDGNIKIWDTNTINQFFQLSTLEHTTTKPKSKKSPPAPSSTTTNSTTTTIETCDLPDKSLRRPLCSMSRHNGVVTSLKFSPDGRFLASGSDDKICLIWEKDPDAINRKQFGVEEQDMEHWTVRRRLVAHDNDIQDICWSPDSNLLITVGLDRSIIIWNGITFERIKRYDIHQSMVKGIVFDPANKFFATASDDRTVRIFRYYKKLNEYNNYEFQMEHIVMDPFKKSPLTSYFRRMSWSPDGQHIAVPNATNGPVPSVAIINRGNWDTDISLIGHEAPVEVCSFSPRLFQGGSGGSGTSGEFHTVVATGGQDRTLAIWSTSNARPIVVLQDIVDNSITDIVWAPEGELLYFSCLDGSITCIKFDKGELGDVVSADMIDAQLTRYGADRETLILPESVEQLYLEEIGNDNNNIPRLEKTKKLTKSVTPTPTTTSVVASPAVKSKSPLTTSKVADGDSTTTQLRKQNITITKSGKKRVAPLLVSSSTNKSTNISQPQQPSIKKRKLAQGSNLSSKLSQSTYFLPRLGLATSIHGLKQKESTHAAISNDEEQDNDNEDMGGDHHTTTTSGTSASGTTNNNSNSGTISEQALKRQKNRQRRKIMELKYPYSFKHVTTLPESLFSNLAILNHDVNRLYRAYSSQDKEVVSSEISSGSALDIDEELMFSVVFTSVESKWKQMGTDQVDDGGEIKVSIEVRNGKPWPRYDDEIITNDKIDFDDPTRVIVYDNQSDERRFTLFFPYRIQHILPVIIDNILEYFVLFSFQGTIQIISAHTGSYTCPSFEIGENIIMTRCSGGYVMILTSSGLFYTWKLSPGKPVTNPIRAVSIATVLNNVEVVVHSGDDSRRSTTTSLIMPNVKAVDVDPRDGSPLVMTDVSADVYGYSRDLECWIKIVDSWYFSVEPGMKLAQDEDEYSRVINRLINRARIRYDEEVRLKRVYAYEFEQDDNVLKQVMTERSKELIEMI
ncbi:HIR1 [[Candida] subhashii]|uniref:Protein HIR n=1 Tax=[Candida] subhashii TaxID=561895 RepID=A0A8J5QMW2_9ASCO|nr:HIR1 [[Candida] subhashii]KAG7663416.1 HIR1 [[Candida] subhashii]